MSRGIAPVNPWAWVLGGRGGLCENADRVALSRRQRNRPPGTGPPSIIRLPPSTLPPSTPSTPSTSPLFLPHSLRVRQPPSRNQSLHRRPIHLSKTRTPWIIGLDPPLVNEIDWAPMTQKQV